MIAIDTSRDTGCEVTSGIAADGLSTCLLPPVVGGDSVVSGGDTGSNVVPISGAGASAAALEAAKQKHNR